VEPTPTSTDVILVKQRHHAKRAGMHVDWRVVVGDKAFSWATRKETPEPGKSIILHEQPIHDTSYALSSRVEIPDGQYGAGITTLEYAQKGNAEIEHGKYVLDLNNGDRFLIKHMPHYGPKQWLLYNISGIGKQASMTNRYLEKLAVSLELYKHKQGKSNKWYVKGSKPEAGYEPTGIRAHKGKPGPKKGKLQLTLSKTKVTAAHPHTNKKTMPKQPQKVKKTRL
jgi:hypothetical protein